MENTSKQLTRKYLVECLEELLSDEYNPHQLVYEDDNQLIQRIINCAFYYKTEANKLENNH